jgi:hypothetical protein
MLVERGVGWTFGAAGVYAYRPDGYRLSKVHVFGTARGSLRGAKEFVARVRLFDVFDAQEVIDFNLRYRDDPVFPFFGTPSPMFLRREQLIDERYELHLRSVEPEINYEHSLHIHERRDGGRGYLRGVLGWRLEADDVEAAPNSVIALERPDALGKIYTGLAWDDRDNDFHPTRGGLHDFTIGSAGPWAGSTAVWTRVSAAFRFYTALLGPKVVVANEFLIDTFVGRPPALVLAHFGGLLEREGIGSRYIGRGYHRRRFGAPTKAYASTEFRITPWKTRLARWEMAIGLKPFFDMGLTFTGKETVRVGVHPSAGFGVYVVWNEFVVVRVDLALGTEGVATYVSDEHTF